MVHTRRPVRERPPLGGLAQLAPPADAVLRECEPRLEVMPLARTLVPGPALGQLGREVEREDVRVLLGLLLGGGVRRLGVLDEALVHARADKVDQHVEALALPVASHERLLGEGPERAALLGVREGVDERPDRVRAAPLHPIPHLIPVLLHQFVRHDRPPCVSARATDPDRSFATSGERSMLHFPAEMHSP